MSELERRNDLHARIAQLEAEVARALKIERLALAQVKETTAVLDLVSLERNELRAEVVRLKTALKDILAVQAPNSDVAYTHMRSIALGAA